MKSRKVFITIGLITFLSVLVLIFKERPLEDGWVGARFRPPSIGVPSSDERNIFFVETSCGFHEPSTSSIHTFDTGLVLPPRLACALESAAAAHVDRPVYLVHSCPVDVEEVLRGNAPDYVRAAFALPNVFLWPVRFNALFFNSPLAELVARASVADSQWLTAHASQLLRHLLLWKYGGTFLDADVLVLRSFGVLRDFAATEADGRVSSSVIDFSWEAPGRLLAETCLNEIVNLQFEYWSTNQDEVMTRAMVSVCNTRNTRESLLPDSPGKMRIVRAKTLTVSTALLLFFFVLIVGYAGILAPYRPLFGWVRVVPLDIDRTTGGPVPGQNNIFFLEVSCVSPNSVVPQEFRAESGLVLSPRTACAVEAAAAAHPDHSLYVVHTCAVDAAALWEGAAPEYALAAFSLPNVFLWPVRLDRLLRGSPLAPLARARDPPPRGYLSILLRFFLLWKYGGTYLDNDIFVLKALSEERDFACAETPEELSASALDFSWSAAGRRLAAECLNETLLLPPAETTRADDRIVTAAARRLCGRQRVSDMTVEQCQGIHILPTPAVYPVPRNEWFRIFSEENEEDTMKAINESRAIHMWNHLSAHAKVDPSSYQPYAQIARRVCPNVMAVTNFII